MAVKTKTQPGGCVFTSMARSALPSSGRRKAGRLTRPPKGSASGCLAGHQAGDLAGGILVHRGRNRRAIDQAGNGGRNLRAAEADVTQHLVVEALQFGHRTPVGEVGLIAGDEALEGGPGVVDHVGNGFVADTTRVGLDLNSAEGRQVGRVAESGLVAQGVHFHLHPWSGASRIASTPVILHRTHEISTTYVFLFAYAV